ncbi:MAG: aminopeptidase P family protein [Bacteroidales bacterium]|nr:MAG: aminopeptidase P family protein [Bacteroidales bacterium]
MRKIAIITMLLPLAGWAQSSLTDEFQARREKVLSMLDTSQVVVLKAINASPLANEYIQDHNFFYLTGINSPANTLLISSKGIKVGAKYRNSIIFYSDLDDVKNIKLGQNDTILQSAELRAIFSKLLPVISKLYYSAPDLVLVNDWLTDKAYFMDREMKNRMKTLFPNLKLESADYFIGKLRSIKSEQEINYIRKATNITVDGLIAAMRLAKPKVWEYELQAAIEYEYTRQGAMLRGFPSIIGSGLNNLILHYSDNTRQTQNGDLIVMDVGAKYKGYSSDITRTIPVSGRFTDAQKEIYSMVLQVQKEVIAMIKPGLSKDELEKAARNAFKRLGYESYFIHGLSHSVGLDVHDFMAERVLRPGMVITIEPGLYFSPNDKAAPERFKGFGVRIEDIILVTENGYEILSKNAPKEIEEIERLMK